MLEVTDNLSQETNSFPGYSYWGTFSDEDYLHFISNMLLNNFVSVHFQARNEGFNFVSANHAVLRD